MNLNDKGNKALWFITKLVIVIVCFYYIFNKIKSSGINYEDFINQFYHLNLCLLILVLLLMPINWYLEVLKWITLTKNIEKQEILSASKGVLSGITSSLFTPNRIGEFIGKISYLKKENQLTGTSLSFLGSYFQLLVTITFGFISILFSWKNNLLPIPDLIIVLVIIITILAYSIIFSSNKIIRFVSKKHADIGNTISTLKKVQKTKAVFYSIARFFVFTTQFYLLLILFGLKISALEAALTISSIYFITSIIPSITFAELGIREITSIELLQHIDNNIIAIIYASFTLWCINLLIPSIIGSYFLIKPNKN